MPSAFFGDRLPGEIRVPGRWVMGQAGSVGKWCKEVEVRGFGGTLRNFALDILEDSWSSSKIYIQFPNTNTTARIGEFLWKWLGSKSKHQALSGTPKL